MAALALLRNHRGLPQSGPLSQAGLCLEAERRCLRAVGLFALLRGDLLAALALLRPPADDGRNSFPTASAEERAVRLAEESLLLRLADDFPAALGCVQRMLLPARAQTEDGQAEDEEEDGELHFSAELLGLLHFLLATHLLADGLYAEARPALQSAFSAYERLQNHSMTAALAALLGWTMLLVGEGPAALDGWLASSAAACPPLSPGKDEAAVPRPFQSDGLLLAAFSRMVQRLRPNGPGPDLPALETAVAENIFTAAALEERTAVSANYLAGLTGNAFWAGRVHQLLEAALLEDPAARGRLLGRVSSAEWRALFAEYFQADPLAADSPLTARDGKATTSQLVLGRLRQLMAGHFPATARTAASREAGPVLFATSPVHSLHLALLAVALAEALAARFSARQERGEPLLAEGTDEEAEAAEQFVLLWLTAAHLEQQQRAVFPALAFPAAFLRFLTAFLLCSFPALLARPGLAAVLSLLNDHYLALLPAARWLSPQRYGLLSAYRPLLWRDFQRSARRLLHLPAAPGDQLGEGETEAVARSGRQHELVRMVADLFGHFLEVHGRPQQSLVGLTATASLVTLPGAAISGRRSGAGLLLGQGSGQGQGQGDGRNQFFWVFLLERWASRIKEQLAAL